MRSKGCALGKATDCGLRLLCMLLEGFFDAS
jgi:hypothetical protein